MFCRFRFGGRRIQWGRLISQEKAAGTTPDWEAAASTRDRIISRQYNPARWCFDAEEFVTDETKTFYPSREDTSVEVLAPVEDSRGCTVWGAGLNYHKHAKEVGLDAPQLPIAFVKTSNSLSGPFDPIVEPRVAIGEMDYEAELAIVIGKKCKDVPVEDAMKYVLGVTAANDVSARKWQGKKGNGQWCRAKSFDTFLPIGPGILTDLDRVNPQTLRISSTLVREEKSTVMQNSNTSDMIFSVPELVSFLSQDTTLLPFTVILTGTPEGVGLGRKPPVFLQPGDTVHVSLESVGTISNAVVKK